LLSKPAIEALRKSLKSSGYIEALTERGDEELRLRRTDVTSPLHTLLALLHAGHQVSVADISRIFEPWLLKELLEEGILSRDAEMIVSPYRMSAAGGLLILHDPYPPLQPDYVSGINPAARTLASLTMRMPVETALDVGTGCGYQALLLAKQAKSVVAVDILPRALWLTTFNAQLNEVTNISCREGNFFDPVRGEHFDLIVCNPPFIVSPDTDYFFRDSGLGGDSVSEMVLKSAIEHLTEGGFATVLVNWGLKRDQEWDEPGRAWLAGRPCDAMFVRWDTAEPLAYAATWNAHLAQISKQQYGASLDRWVEYMASLDFDSIAELGVVLRHRPGQNWVVGFAATESPSGDATGQVTRIFAAQDYIEEHGSGDLLDQHFALINGHRLDQAMEFVNGSYEIHAAFMHPSAGLGLHGEVPANIIPVLFNLSAGTLREVVTSFARDMDADLDESMQNAAAMVEQLLRRGLLDRLEFGS
jgi:hypothetical protein